MAKLSYFLLLALFVTSSALANQVLTKGTKILGKQFSVTEQQGSVASGNGVNALTQVTFFGKAIPLLSSAVDYTVASGQINQKNNELYVNGIKVWTGAGTFSNNTYEYSGSVAPTQINMPVFAYTVGPLVLEVNAGIAFEGAMDAKLSSPLFTPTLSSILTTETLMNASLVTKATASGFVEGHARVLIVQAGIGGDVNIIDGNASVAASILIMDPTHPTLTYDGKLQVLNGKIHAFIDYRTLSGWKHWKDFSLYSWNGFCWSMGGQSCGTIN